ncbi:hypothetical protein [Methylobacterium cerastii]|uniref:hypothetical protein n=1 Tax=Methylobacterium cerastii TaxID=932741 RepID=UPI001EE1B082|nr:hypothetical protein [Methylobacterium cerastii]
MLASEFLTDLKQQQTDEVLHLGRTVPFDLFMERKARVRDLLKFILYRHDAYYSALECSGCSIFYVSIKFRFMAQNFLVLRL